MSLTQPTSLSRTAEAGLGDLLTLVGSGWSSEEERSQSRAESTGSPMATRATPEASRMRLRVLLHWSDSGADVCEGEAEGADEVDGFGFAAEVVADGFGNGADGFGFDAGVDIVRTGAVGLGLGEEKTRGEERRLAEGCGEGRS